MLAESLKDWRKVAERNEINGIKRRVYLANATERSWHDNCFVFWFGSCGTTYVLAYGKGIDSALESAAQWLADYAPGHIMPHDSEELQELLREARIEFRKENQRLEDPDHGSEDMSRVYESATADLTYTESGYLTSYDWGIALDNPNPAELLDFVKDRR
jgi:hypothetical protein